jgi:8-oxo-dGTP pyrophosphatase MutT (NUDIX family)
MTSVTLSPFLSKVKHLLRDVDRKPLENSGGTLAAVALLLFEKEESYNIVFNKRSQQVEHHKGDIAFPGGVFDEGDLNAEATALRETWEEMGIDQQDVSILGQLSEIETRSNFRVVPFVGTFPYPYRYNTNPMEVAEVIEVPIDHLLDPGNYRVQTEMVNGEPWLEHFYTYRKHVIYGATARMLYQFLTLIG